MARDLLTVEQREIRDLVRTLARERIAPRAAEIDKSAEFPWDVVELFRENGIFGVMFDEAYGGKLASGEWIAAYALTEAGSGSDSAAMRLAARRDGDDYVLDGSKRFITNAGVAHVYVTFAKTDPDAAHGGISAFLVEAGSPGFAVGRIEPKMGIKGSTTGELNFDGCRVPAANRLGEEGDGFRLAMRVLDRSRPGIAAQALGIAQGATDYALAYAGARETFGEPIAKHQLIAGKLADMETKCEAARGLLYRCGQAIDDGLDGPELTKLGAMTKLFCSDVAMEVTTDAVQVLGGYGYIQEYPVERTSPFA